MNEDFETFLRLTAANDEAIEIAAKSFISEFTGDVLPKEMESSVHQWLGSSDQTAKISSDLESSPKIRMVLCKSFLQTAWEAESNRARIRNAFSGTTGKMPAIEAAILAMVAMYGMYLIANHFKKPNVTVKVGKKGQSVSKEVEITFSDPESPLKDIGSVFSALK